MKLTTLRRVLLLSLSPALVLVALMVLCLALPESAKTEPAKAPPFPLSLFAQATDDDYIDDETCASCHSEPHALFQKSPHKTFVSNPKDSVDKRGCQSCHGPGGPHLSHQENPDEIYKFIISYNHMTPKQTAMACLRCHQDTMTETHWHRTEHAKGDVTCTSCHSIHQDGHGNKPGQDKIGNGKSLRQPIFVAAREPRKLLKSDEATLCGQCHQRAVSEFRHNFHHPLPEGRVACSDCHEIHPRRGAEMQTAAHTRVSPARGRGTKAADAGETCATCHAQQAGPFAFEHDPVSGVMGEGCTECHRPHGSNNPRMLNTFSRGLCAQCHTDKTNNHFPGRTCWQSGCHVAVHGSNNDHLLLRR